MVFAGLNDESVASEPINQRTDSKPDDMHAGHDSLPIVMYSREQIYVHGPHMFVIKKLEKEVLRLMNAGFAVDEVMLMRFCHDFFDAVLRERAERAAREEAWRREWSGKKGRVKDLCDRIDAGSSGFIDFDELQTALREIPDFFGYSEPPTGTEDARSLTTGTEDICSSTSSEPGGTPEGMHEWLQDEVDKGSSGSGAYALFERLDADGDGKISWEEFWNTIGEWMETGFNVLEEIRQRELERERERERLRMEEEMRRRAAEAEAARLAALEAARLAEEERLRALQEAERLAREEAAERERRKAEERARREALMAAKEEEERQRMQKEAEAAAAEEEERRRQRQEREARLAAEQEAARLARLAEEEEARRRAAEEEEERRRRQEELDRWRAAVAAAVEVAHGVITRNDPDGARIICEEALRQLAEGEPGLGDAGAALLMSSEQGSSGQLYVCALAPDGRTTPGGVVFGTFERDFPDSASILTSQFRGPMSSAGRGGKGSVGYGGASRTGGYGNVFASSTSGKGGWGGSGVWDDVKTQLRSKDDDHTPGLTWHKLDSRPQGNEELVNADLSAALARGQLKFTRAELDAFDVEGLQWESVVNADGHWFSPSSQASNLDDATSGHVLEADGVGMAALRDSHTGRAFGTLCSGGQEGRGRVPDEFLQMMTAEMGALIDKAWRKARLMEMMEVTLSSLELIFDGGVDDLLDGAPQWQEAVGPSVVGGGDGGKGSTGKYEITLQDARAADGAVAGTIIIPVRDGCKLGDHLEETLKVTASMIKEVKAELDALTMGDPLPDWVPKGLLLSCPNVDPQKLLQLALPVRLLENAKERLAAIPMKDLVGELRSYKTPPEAVTRVMQGVILLLERATSFKEIPSWMKGVHQQMNAEMVRLCLDFDASVEGHDKAWTESKKATEGLSVDEVLKRGSAAVQIFQKWVESCRLVRRVCEDLRKEGRELEGGKKMVPKRLGKA